MSDEYNWQDLDRKLAQGISLRQACDDVKIPYANAIAWLRELDKIENFDATMTADQRCAEKSREIGIFALEEIIYTCERMPEERVKAAKALLAHYRDERKRLETKKKEENPAGQQDLLGNWDLRTPGT
jgi:hypothetical protein